MVCLYIGYDWSISISRASSSDSCSHSKTRLNKHQPEGYPPLRLTLISQTILSPVFNYIIDKDKKSLYSEEEEVAYQRILYDDYSIIRGFVVEVNIICGVYMNYMLQAMKSMPMMIMRMLAIVTNSLPCRSCLKKR